MCKTIRDEERRMPDIRAPADSCFCFIRSLSSPDQFAAALAPALRPQWTVPMMAVPLPG